MAFTNFLSHSLLNHVLRNIAYTSPTTVYLALFTTATTDAGGGTEATGGSYARQAVTFAAPASKHTDNTGVISFSNMPAGTFTHAAMFDALAGGNMLTHAPMPSAITTLAGEGITFAIADIDETFT